MRMNQADRGIITRLLYFADDRDRHLRPDLADLPRIYDVEKEALRSLLAGRGDDLARRVAHRIAPGSPGAAAAVLRALGDDAKDIEDTVENLRQRYGIFDDRQYPFIERAI